jgi:hypothetical protein
MIRTALFAISLTIIVSPLVAQDYNYDVSGESEADGSVYGNVDAYSGTRDVEGSIYTEDGEEKSFTGEWVGNREIEGYDEDGNFVTLETD